jgi:hypothetical protein
MQNTVKHIPPSTLTPTYPSPDDFPSLPKTAKNIPGLTKQTPTPPIFPTSLLHHLVGSQGYYLNFFEQLESLFQLLKIEFRKKWLIQPIILTVM